jgi:NTP pyrophosphatase (non-canonical NTP hydrolase)
MELTESLERVRKIKQVYNTLNRIEGYKSWGASEYVQALQGDVGDLAKLVLAQRGYAFAQKDVEERIARELADCLWSVLVLADELDVDINQEFSKMLHRLEDKIQDRTVVGSRPTKRTV